MEQYYSSERNVQILVSLMKQHGIKKVVASPGSTNVCFVASLQQDPYFEIYSCVDERSAAYMAVGMAAETSEAVVLSCTGATASRNYFPALTEAYYRQIPILVVTSTQEESKIGHLIPQVINRSQQPLDTVRFSVHLQTVKDRDDEANCVIKANTAILELNHHGMGPVHINLTTRYSRDFLVKELTPVRKISRYLTTDQLPELPQCKMAVFVGTHSRWSSRLTTAVEAFCESHNAVVFSDPASNYNGKYRVNNHIRSFQPVHTDNMDVDLLIHIGTMSDFCGIVCPKDVWRVSEDGEISDRYGVLSNVFEMTEVFFFEYYSKGLPSLPTTYYDSCQKQYDEMISILPALPLSHIWCASELYNRLPMNCTLHLGILSPVRSWSYFSMHKSIEIWCNQGGFGIDGNMSTLIGASIMQPDRLFFGAVGDLSFFYDINSLGNRHIGNNIRILLVNNGMAAEFLLFKQQNTATVNDIEKYISAGGHFGQKSPELVKHFATDLGFEYLSASTKEEFKIVSERFVTAEITDRPMILEVFTDVQDEDKALYDLWHLMKDKSLRGFLKKGVKEVLGDDNSSRLKGILKH